MYLQRWKHYFECFCYRGVGPYGYQWEYSSTGFDRMVPVTNGYPTGVTYSGQTTGSLYINDFAGLGSGTVIIGLLLTHWLVLVDVQLLQTMAMLHSMPTSSSE